MPQISTNKRNRTAATCNNVTIAGTGPLLLRIANQLEESICHALMDGNVSLAERLVVSQTELQKLAQTFDRQNSDTN